jgi:integrase
MARVATKLTPARNGCWTARKRIPVDVRDAYARLYGVSSEEWFNSGPVSLSLATAKMREWLTEIENRITNIRAERNGGGQALTPMQGRALAGEWYHWFTGHNLAKPKSAEYWEAETSEPYDALRHAVWGSEPWPEGRDPFEDWNENARARERVRPVVADCAKTTQFLHAKSLTLDPASRDMFLDHVCKDFFEALELLKQRAKGNYGPDKHAEQFPKLGQIGDPGLTPWSLFSRWVAEAKPANSTVDRWRSVFLKLREDFPGAAVVTTEEAQVWARGLISPERQARTVNDVWVIAARTIFGWAKDQRLLTHNPFTGVRIKVPRSSTTRPQWFTDAEIAIILSASLAISRPRSKTEAAKRWLPWLCAYTGARGGEIAQLRGADCIEQDGAHAIRITPEAGTVKTKQAREVPLHEHLIHQGFLDFVNRSGKGPLFYVEHKKPPAPAEATNPPKARSVKTREHIAAWVREIGVDDPRVKPNHAWRHTFMLFGTRAEITERLLFAITGHTPASVGGSYGKPSLKDTADALKKFPRYSTGDGHGD